MVAICCLNYLNRALKYVMKMSTVRVWLLTNVSHVKFLCEVFHLRLAHGGFEIVATPHAALEVTVGQCSMLSFSRRRHWYWSWQNWMSEFAIQFCLAIMFAICEFMSVSGSALAAESRDRLDCRCWTGCAWRSLFMDNCRIQTELVHSGICI